jgi:hypothetical protein
MEEPPASIFTSTLKMEVPYSSESVHTLQDIWTCSVTTCLSQGPSRLFYWSSVIVTRFLEQRIAVVSASVYQTGQPLRSWGPKVFLRL